MSNDIRDLVIDQFNLRIYSESIPRIIKACELLTLEQIWHKQNENSNSIGHLILHLCGNVTQWIGSGVGQFPDDRNRKYEFSASETFSKSDLKEKLLALRPITDAALQTIENKDLHDTRSVQGFEETVLGIIIHVIEHFSYHTGQIAVIAKYLENVDLGFYDGLDLDITS